MTQELPYVPLDEFNAKVDEFAKTNWILKNLFNHPKSKVRTWQDLPKHLIQDLFTKVGCKPSIQAY
jgi:hypothetical protein